MEDDLKASLPALRAALSRGVAYAPRPAAAPAADAVAGAAAGSPPPQSTFGMFAMGPPGADASLLPCSMLPRSAGGATTTDAAAASDPRAEAARHIARTEVDSMVGRVLDSLAPLILDDGAAVPLAPVAAAPAPAALAPATRDRRPRRVSSEAAAVARLDTADERRAAAVARFLRSGPPPHGPARLSPNRPVGSCAAPVPAPAATARPDRFAAAAAPAAAPADAAPAEPPPPPALSPRSAAAAAYDIL